MTGCAANTAVLKVVEVKTLPEGSFQFSFESKGDTAPLGGQGSKQGQVAYAAAALITVPEPAFNRGQQ